jgi:hypothetical protein
MKVVVVEINYLFGNGFVWLLVIVVEVLLEG